ncbi:hypothetical protein GUITHDRAFT_122049 [Guillardia theta CCMP2712]|uniref:Uncharacterized protein n=1 Tax=Guillardia theta (strain CCMP2712) TaxID=905079 RepID=L1I691_GUITC|nr:hypothetical protein GUITHDRAFT_122049 [Guillardia theta CCMP2712]EKX31761.1 hypothetical protein GUITHDRAFT_122049 [Guillardia theta CCMP2712]|eukprot:XP_005818741.1 hypothetical protein GUITHDRAFT_122049 [Guillardia theta CCMP2712]
MRELLEELKREDRPPAPETLKEHERTLAAAAATAEEARRRSEQVNEAEDEREDEDEDEDEDEEGKRVGKSGKIQRRRRVVEGEARKEASESPFLSAPAMQPSVASSLPHSLSDRRSQLLGRTGHVLRRRVGGEGSHVQEALEEDKKIQSRMKAGRGEERREGGRLKEEEQEELANMTSTLKRNVEAMHATIVQDNKRLTSMDDEMAGGIQKIKRINLRVDEQRAKNRRTTCLQCIMFLLVSLLFFSTFFLMRFFGKAKQRLRAATPDFLLAGRDEANAQVDEHQSWRSSGETSMRILAEKKKKKKKKKMMMMMMMMMMVVVVVVVVVMMMM